MLNYLLACVVVYTMYLCLVLMSGPPGRYSFRNGYEAYYMSLFMQLNLGRTICLLSCCMYLEENIH